MRTQPPYRPDDLLAKFLLGEASPDEADEASKWIAGSAENETYFHQLRETLNRVNPQTPVQSIDENEAWKRFQEKINRQELSQKTIPAKSIPITRNPLFRMAAAILIAVGTIALAYIAYRDLTPAHQIELASSESPRKQELPDGSSIVLNKKSTISYPDRFKGNERVVTLQGEAFFSVKADKKKPFIVQVNGLTVKVVGTSFNIRTNAGKTEVIVETGIVQVTGKGKMVELHPREKILIDESGLPAQKDNQPDQLYNYYRTNNFTCDNTPLWKLVEVLQEAYGVQIEIANPSYRNLLLTTTFENESLDKILEIVAETLNLTIVKQNQKIILQ